MVSAVVAAYGCVGGDEGVNLGVGAGEARVVPIVSNARDELLIAAISASVGIGSSAKLEN